MCGKPRGSISTQHLKNSTEMHACNPSTGETESRGSEFKVSYIVGLRPAWDTQDCLRRKIRMRRGGGEGRMMRREEGRRKMGGKRESKTEKKEEDKKKDGEGRRRGGEEGSSGGGEETAATVTHTLDP